MQGSRHPLPGIKQFRLDGKVALITGGSKGLGSAIAEGLASAGASVVLVSRTKSEARREAEIISSLYNVRTMGIKADVTKSEETQLMVDETVGQLGSLDILINSAGINIRGSIEELSDNEFKDVMDVNVNGTWLSTKAAVPIMKKNGWGRIVNMASALGLVGLANRTPYTSSKGAITQMTKALALELAKTGVTVNSICPGPFLTDMNKPIAETEEGKKFIVGATAFERWGEVKEIQGAAIFLASEAASYITGTNLVVDGGWTAR